VFSRRPSEYVDDEIRRFVEVNEAGNIIPVLLEGIPNNAAEGGPEELMDFPAALCEATGYFFPKINQVRISNNRKARCMLCKKRLS